jgi:transposase
MATIQKKKVKGRYYWYIVESRRVNGKPRPVVLAYLGRIEDMLAKLNGEKKIELSSRSHGAVTSLWKTAIDNSVIDILGKHLPSRKRDDLSVAQSLLIAAIHRVIEPASKNAFSDWAKKTTLPDIAGFECRRITSQHFWDQMDTVTDEQIKNIQSDITSMIMYKHDFTPETLFFDTTNFFTFVDTQNQHCEIAQRGHNKQKRNDLRQFGLAMLVSKEYFIPLSCEVYRGNMNDSRMFREYLPGLIERFKNTGIKSNDITIVFDKGNNSETAFKKMDAAELNFIASLPGAHHKDLLDISTDAFDEKNVGEKNIWCYRTEKMLWDKKRTIIIYISEKLREGQLSSIDKSLMEKLEELGNLKEKLNLKSKVGTKKEIEKKVKSIIKGEYCEKIIDYEIKKYNGKIDFEYRINHDKYEYLFKNVLGKRILVTTRGNWNEKEIIEGYWGQSYIENSFKHLKNPRINAVRPQYHWTDQKIKVHTFCCLIGFLLMQLMHKKIAEAGIKISHEKLIEKLSEIRKCRMILPIDAKNKKIKTEEHIETSDELSNLLYRTINE